ncbi:MAG: ribonuclease P protein component [Candidatus Acetothermia bacterium]
MVDRGFQKRHRLRSRSDFKHVYRHGRRFEFESFILFLKKTGDETPRIGITTPKNLGTAVERNRLKRVVREAFRKHKETFTNYDVIAEPRVCATSMTNSELTEGFLRGFKIAKAELEE